MKIDLTDCSFLIALKVDSQDRIDNLDITVNYLQHHFDTEIIISEQGPVPVLEKRYNCKYVFTQNDEFFNRQKGVNIAARNSNNPIILHYDADIILSPLQIELAIRSIRNKELELVYPYDGYFYDVPKHFHKRIRDEQSIGWINTNDCVLFTKRSVGGVVCFDKHTFWKHGGANENFKGLGYEDNEIFDRFKNRKTKMGRVTCPLFHLNHERKDTSYNFNPYVDHNRDEYVRIRDMDSEQLEKEINSWSWKQ